MTATTAAPTAGRADRTPPLAGVQLGHRQILRSWPG